MSPSQLLTTIGIDPWYSTVWTHRVPWSPRIRETMTKVLEMLSLWCTINSSIDTRAAWVYVHILFQRPKNRTDRQRIRIDYWNYYFCVTNARLVIIGPNEFKHLKRLDRINHSKETEGNAVNFYMGQKDKVKPSGRRAAGLRYFRHCGMKHMIK